MKSNRKGFTLIELLIVIAIIGTLAVLFVPRFLDAPAKARDTERVTTISKIRSALVEGQLDSTPLPESGCVDNDSFNEYKPALGGKIPVDPSEDENWTVKPENGDACGGEYAYVKGPSGDYSFGLYAKLESVDQANASCEAISEDGTDLDEEIQNDSDACFVMLVE